MGEAYEPEGAQLRAFAASKSGARAIIGPVYAGRKTACVHEIVKFATRRAFARQRQWRWLVIGGSRDELDRLVLPICRRWLPPAATWDDKTRVLGLEYQLGDQVPHLLELVFLGFDS